MVDQSKQHSATDVATHLWLRRAFKTSIAKILSRNVFATYNNILRLSHRAFSWDINRQELFVEKISGAISNFSTLTAFYTQNSSTKKSYLINPVSDKVPQYQLRYIGLRNLWRSLASSKNILIENMHNHKFQEENEFFYQNKTLQILSNNVTQSPECRYFFCAWTLSLHSSCLHSYYQILIK